MLTIKIPKWRNLQQFLCIVLIILLLIIVLLSKYLLRYNNALKYLKKAAFANSMVHLI